MRNPGGSRMSSRRGAATHVLEMKRARQATCFRIWLPATQARIILTGSTIGWAYAPAHRSTHPCAARACSAVAGFLRAWRRETREDRTASRAAILEEGPLPLSML